MFCCMTSLYTTLVQTLTNVITYCVATSYMMNAHSLNTTCESLEDIAGVKAKVSVYAFPA